MNEEQDNTDEKIRNRLNQIFPPQVASRVVDVVVSNRPSGWSRHSNAPYFKEVYGKQMRDDIEKMLANGKPLVYRYGVWCTDETGMSKGTLYTRINQSIRYVVEKMDTPDKRYSSWYDRVRVHRRSGVGVMIEFIAGLHEGEEFKGEEVEPREHMPVWRREMEDWLESDSMIPFCKEGLALSPDEIEQLKQQFAQLTNVMSSITSASVKIVKLK